jgi:hypothetical protein
MGMDLKLCQFENLMQATNLLSTQDVISHV